MGCWNGTCGLSNLPIESGDEILLFVLKNNGTEGELGGGFSYATDRYAPVGLPVHGQYNDYGGIENITQNGHRMFDFLTTDRQFKIKLNDSVNMIPQDAEELLNDVIERGNSSYSLMMIRKDVLDGIKTQTGATHAAVFNAFTEFTNAFNQESAKMKDETESEGNTFNERLYQSLIVMNVRQQIGYNNPFVDILGRHDHASLRPFVRLARTTPHEDVLSGIADVLYVNNLFEDLRKFWTPQSGAGSQDDATDKHAALCNTMLDVIGKRDAQRDDDEY